MLKSLDLFTGIAGFTLGLRTIAQPVAYCEIDPHAVQMLQHRMTEGHIPKAPICNDIQTLNTDWLRSAVQSADVDLITAGFPCQGFSLLGHRRGFDHSGSSLYSQVVRLVEEVQPAMVLLENVSDIVNMGLQVIVDSLCGRLGYELRWMILGAGELGAPHLRRRWFCMACRPDDAARALQATVLQQRCTHTPDYSWTRRDVPPMTLACEPSRSAFFCRAGMLLPSRSVRRAGKCGGSGLCSACILDVAFIGERRHAALETTATAQLAHAWQLPSSRRRHIRGPSAEERLPPGRFEAG